MAKHSVRYNVASFFKKNVYYILLALCILAIGTIITVTVVNSNRGASVPTDLPGDESNNETPGDDIVNPPVVERLTFALPVADATIGWDYSVTEAVFNPTTGYMKLHEAVDYIAEAGTAVSCVADGVVTTIETDPLYGTCVTVEHKDGVSTVYRSLAENVGVSVGDRVRTGDQLGEIASSLFELSQGPHLHFETMKEGALVSPYDYFETEDK